MPIDVYTRRSHDFHIMATRRVEIGPTGETVRARIQEFRKLRGMTLADLSASLGDSHPLSANTISQIETGGRRVDVDDLVAIARALRVGPNALLTAHLSDPDLEPDTRERAELIDLAQKLLAEASIRHTLAGALEAFADSNDAKLNAETTGRDGDD